MRRLLCAAALLALVTPQVASAQRHDHDDRDRGNAHQTARPQQKQVARQQDTRQQRARVVQQQQVRQQRTVRTRTVRTEQDSRTRQVQVRNRTQRPAGYHPAHFQRVHAAAFRYPRGYHYRRWSTGSILPRLFLSSTYYYSDWYDLGFGPPPPGYQWVRYGPDLLLVNVYTGRIRNVVYNVFY